MSTQEHRLFIYAALLVLCAIGGVFIGATAALWTFLQVAAVVELISLVGNFRGATSLHS